MKMEMTGEMKSLKIERLSDIRKLFQRNVVPSYARFDLALDHGAGSYVYDVAGKRYLDLGGGIAVCGVTAARIASRSLKGTCRKPDTIGSNPFFTFSCPVAAMPASVRPWKEFTAVMISNRPSS